MRRTEDRRWLPWLGGILLATFAVYVPSLDNGFTNWDDNFYVTANPLLPHPDFGAILATPVAGNYHPLTIASLALNYALSGLNPSSYHALSLLLHLANTALVFLFVRRLSRGRFWTSAATSALFGIHPMHVESVAWVAERKDVLYAFFYLLGLIAYLRYVDMRKKGWLWVAWAVFLLSAASKPAAVVFPLALLAIDFFRRRPLRGPVLLEKVPFFAVALVDGLLTLQAQRAGGAISEYWNPMQKVLFAAHGALMYVVKLFVPVRLSAIYPYPAIGTGNIGAAYYASFAAFVVLVPAALYLARRSRVLLFGVAFYFINIVLVLQVFTIGGAVMADRYTYLSYVGLLFALTWWLDERETPRPAGIPVRSVVAGVVLLLLPVSAIQTWRRCEVWQNAETLWNDTIAKYPHRIADAYNNRGFYFYETKRYDEALADFDEALALNSRAPKFWVNKGNVLAALNQNDSALVSYERALALRPNDPDALNNRGAAKLQMNNLPSAVMDFTRALELNPRQRDAYTNRALAHVRMRAYEPAIEDSRRAIELAPESPDTYLQYGVMGVALWSLGRHPEAIRALDEAIRRTPPGDPRLGGYYLFRSYSWRSVGDRSRALQDAREAARFGTQVAPAYLRQLGG